MGAAGIGWRAGGPKVFGLPVIDPTSIGGLNTGPVAVAAAGVSVETNRVDTHTHTHTHTHTYFSTVYGWEVPQMHYIVVTPPH